MSKAIIILLILITTAAVYAGPVARAGDWAQYKLTSARADAKPPVNTITITAGPRDGGRQWWEMVGIKPDGSAFIVRALSNRVPMTSLKDGIGQVERYLFKDGEHPWLEYVDKSVGRALLPKFDFRERLLPCPSSGSTFEGAFATTGRYIGHGVALDRAGSGLPFGTSVAPKSLSLDPTLIVGTARIFRENEDRRMTDQEYTYHDLTQAEYDELIGAGFNFFLTNGTERELLLRERPVFFDKFPEATDFPNILYRSNYTGCVMFDDEPAVLTDFNPFMRVTDAANLLRLRVAETLAGGEYYGSRRISQRWKSLGICLGTWDLYDKDIPCWDAVYQSAYYQVEAGASGMVHEGMYRLESYNADLQRLFDPGIQVNAEEMLKLHYAFMRGAARCFNANWGMSIYGQADPKLAPPAMSMAYDMGARYIWYWTGGLGYHLPYREQVDFTSKLRAHEKAHPRQAMDKLRRAAKVAIVFPEGYSYFGTSGLVWNGAGMPVDALNTAGTPHRFVMASAMWEAIKLLREGVDFDFVVEGEPARKAGYQRLITIGRDGMVKGMKSAASRVNSQPSIRLLSAVRPTAPPTSAPRMTAHPVAPGSIKVDGDLSDWASADWLTLSSPDQYLALDSAVPGDISAEVAFGFDRESLYIAAKVQDKEHHHPYDAWSVWRGDSLVIGLDPWLDRAKGEFAEDDLSFGIALDRSGIDSYKWRGRLTRAARSFSNADIMIKRDGATTLYEVRVPLDELTPLTPSLMPAAGLNVVVGQANEPGLVGYLRWTPGLGEEKYRDPSQFGVLEFSDSARSLDRPVMQFEPRVIVTERGKPITFKAQAAAGSATNATLRVRLRYAGGTSSSKREFDIPAGRSEFEVSLPNGLPPGTYIADLTLTDGKGDFAQSSGQVFIYE